MAILKRPGAYERIHATGTRADGGARRAVEARPASRRRSAASRRCSMSCSPTSRCATIAARLPGDADLMRRFNALLRERGILKGESKYYISLAHTDEDIAFTIDAWKSAIKELKGLGFVRKPNWREESR